MADRIKRYNLRIVRGEGDAAPTVATGSCVLADPASPNHERRVTVSVSLGGLGADLDRLVTRKLREDGTLA